MSIKQAKRKLLESVRFLVAVLRWFTLPKNREALNEAYGQGFREGFRAGVRRASAEERLAESLSSREEEK